MRLIFQFGSLLLIGVAATAAAQLQMGPADPVVLRSGSGGSVFVLQNTGKRGIPLKLAAGPFVDEISHTTMAKPKVAFVLAAGGGKLPAIIKKGQTLEVEADVTELAGSSDADAEIFNGAEKIGVLQAVASDAPLNVSVDGAGNPEKQLTYRYGEPATITLKNGDAEAYQVEWTFSIDGSRKAGDSLALAPNGSSQLTLAPTADSYSWLDSLRPAEKTAELRIRMQGPRGAIKGVPGPTVLPERELPVTLSMARRGQAVTGLLSYGYVFFVLLAGGLLSLVGSSMLPGALKKIALRRVIDDLANRTSGVSTRIDSYLRVLLRLERKKINILIDRAGKFSLSSGEIFDQASVAIERLTKRLVAAERLDELRRRFDEASATAPPSVTNDLDKTLQMAASQLHSFSLPQEDLDAANALLVKAEASIRMLDDPDALAKLVSQNFINLKARIALFSPENFADLREALGGIFAILSSPFGEPKNITPQMLFVIDHDIAAMQTTLDYAMARASLASGPSAHCEESGEAARQRLLARECELLGLLGTLSWGALREATILVQEMREDVYESDLLAEIGKKGQAEVFFDTQKARPFLPVFFSIGFKNTRFNNAAAIKRLVCRWEFPKQLFEDGWKVCHFFDENEPNPKQKQRISIHVSVRGEQDPSSERKLVGEIEVQERQRSREGSRLFVEAVRFAIAFGVALAGLLSGALEQLGKLDFLPATVAILALGFGADSIKNLLTQAPKKSGS